MNKPMNCLICGAVLFSVFLPELEPHICHHKCKFQHIYHIQEKETPTNMRVDTATGVSASVASIQNLQKIV
jgi:hypothetical protein